jgi:hypothetical protein
LLFGELSFKKRSVSNKESKVSRSKGILKDSKWQSLSGVIETKPQNESEEQPN